MKAILTYHSIDDSGSVISMGREIFARHVKWLASGRVRVVSLEELVSSPVDDDAVALTFDDGFRNFGEVAAPMLREHGLPATVFVVSDAVGGSNAWCGRGDPGVPVLPLLDWEALGRLVEQGFTVGAHTRTHPRLAGSSPATIEDEVVTGRERIVAELGTVPTTFAYPYGSQDARAVACVARHFTYGCGTALRMLDPSDSRACLPRLDTYYLRIHGQLEAWGTPAFSARLRLRDGLRRVRSFVTASA